MHTGAHASICSPAASKNPAYWPHRTVVLPSTQRGGELAGRATSTTTRTPPPGADACSGASRPKRARFDVGLLRACSHTR